jgi:hypothetical protein
MNVSNAIQECRAEKMFDSAFVISEEEVGRLLQAVVETVYITIP